MPWEKYCEKLIVAELVKKLSFYEAGYSLLYP
jgi:hypothetical protein